MSPPLSTKSIWQPNFACRVSSAPAFALMSSRMAACGHPPVSIARMRDAGSALFLMRNSWSSRVKMSFVTVAMRGGAGKAGCRKMRGRIGHAGGEKEGGGEGKSAV